MIICTSYTTDRSDADLIPSVVLAKGDTLDELIPAISDEVATELAMNGVNGKAIEIEDQDGEPIDASVFGVSEALANGATCIIARHTLANGESYENVLTINRI